MPTYDYRCKNCEYDFTVEAKMSDPAPTKGPQCHGADHEIVKLMVPVMGWVKGSSPMSAPARTQALAEVSGPAPAAESNPAHICSKYCEHH